jgi:phosphatidylinositol-3-phosphatase
VARLVVAGSLALTLLAVGCATGASRPGHTSSSEPPSRLVVLVMENKEYADVIGRRSAPYMNRLARRYALAGRYFAIGHPSLPNYLTLIGGSRFGVHSDCTSCKVNATNLVDQLETAHVPWKAYMEDMPAPCYQGASTGGYAKKHDPFLYFEDVVRDPARCRRVVPYGRLQRDLRRGRLPSFTWITPNLCHSTHECGLRQGDRFLARLVPRLLGRLGPHGALVLTWDEGTSTRGCCRLAAGGHIPTIVAGPEVRRAHVSAARLDHYSTLRTIEDALGLPHLRGAACRCTRSLASLFQRPPRVSR